jgi:hypothetical protein
MKFDVCFVFGLYVFYFQDIVISAWHLKVVKYVFLPSQMLTVYNDNL